MKKTDSCANLLPFCFVFHSFKSKGIMVSYHLINPHHRYRLQKVFLIHSAETTEVLSPLPVIILGLTVSRSFVFSSPHAAPNRCILANLVSLHKTSWGISNAPMHHDYFAEVAFLSYCIQLSLQQLPKGRYSWQSILHRQPRQNISIYVTTFKCCLLCVRSYL